jgi:hypothetical protein
VQIYDYVKIYGNNIIICDEARICGHARVYDKDFRLMRKRLLCR